MSGTMVYTVDLGNGHVMDIEGPEGATPEQLQAVAAQQPNAAPAAETKPYTVTAPNGQAYQVDAPPGQSAEQIRTLALQQYPDLAQATAGSSWQKTGESAPSPSLGDAAATSAEALGANALRAAGGIPDLLASGGEAVTNAIGSGLGAIGDAVLRAHGADQETLDKWSQLMAPRHVAGINEGLEQAGAAHAATPGMDFAQQLALGAALPVPGGGATPRAASIPAAGARAAGSDAAELVAAGQKFGIDVPMGATGRGASIVEKGFDNLPISAGITQDARNVLTKQVGDAVEDVAKTYGPTTSFGGIGEAAQTGAKKWVDRFQEVAGKVYDAIPIKPTVSSKLDNTIGALKNLTSKFASNPELASMVNNSKFARYLHALEGSTDDVATGVLDASGNPITRQVQKGGQLSWQDLKDFRSKVGEEIGDRLFSDGTSKAELRQLYAGLSEDMKATAAAQGPGALRAFERANNLFRQGQERIDGALTKLLGNDSSKTAESAAAKIQAIARDGKSSADLATLIDIRKSLPPEEWSQVQNGVVRLLGQPANSAGREFNPQTFVQTFGDMAPEARNLFFGNGELRKNLDEFAGVIGNLAKNNSLRNTSNTAAGLTGTGTVGTIAAGLLNPILGLKMAGAGATNYGLAKLWTNPKFVKWATGYTKMVNGAARAGMQPNAQQFAVHNRLLSRLAGAEPAIANDIAGLQQQLQQAFSATPYKAAAQPEDGQ